MAEPVPTADQAGARATTTAAADNSPGALAHRLAPLGPLTVYRPAPGQLPLLLSRAAPGGALLDLTLSRPAPGPPLVSYLRLVADGGDVLAREPVTLADAATTAAVRPDLPAEWVDRLARLEIENQATAAAVLLIDEDWKRRPVGLVTDLPATGERPLIGTFFYVEQALAPASEVRRGRIADLLSRDLSVLVLADVGSLDAASAASVRAWVDAGGVLLRFAGPSLLKAADRADPLLPVVLRPTDRVLGGALSWGSPDTWRHFRNAARLPV